MNERDGVSVENRRALAVQLRSNLGEVRAEIAGIRESGTDVARSALKQAAAEVGELEAAADLLSSASVEHAPGYVLGPMVTAFDVLRNSLVAIRGLSFEAYDRHGQSPAAAANALAIQFRDQFSKQFVPAANALMGHLAAAETARSVGPDTTPTIDAAREELRRASEVRVELQHALEAARAELAQLGVSRQTGLFASAATEHENAAGRWLRAIGLLAAGTTLLAALNLGFEWDGATVTGTAGAQLLVAKLVVFSLLVSAIVWCGKMYRAHRHNAVVNRHRQRALDSFATFTESAPADTRAAVLVQATTAIFTPQHTGYSTTDAEPAVTAPAAELVKALAAAK